MTPESEAKLLRAYRAAIEAGQDGIADTLGDVVLDVKDLHIEIDRLKELVRDMWRFTGTACKKYPRLFDPSAQGGQMVQLNMIDCFEQRMQELGVEAD